MKPTKIAFEESYSDDSGVEFGVSFDNHHKNVQIESIDIINWPLHKLQWLIDRLKDIAEVASDDSPAGRS